MNLAARTPEAIEASKLLYLGIGFSLVWVAIAAYLFSLSRRQRSLEERMDRLRRGPNGGS
ncbi:MAG: CcmD family protein [Actinomycetota bacterium]